MKIEHYSFGTITVNGKTFEKDLIIFPDSLCPDWKRIKGHVLSFDDLTDIIRFEPVVLIVGTGGYAAMTIPQSTKEALSSRGIKLIAAPTEKACMLFNQHIERKIKTAGAFHLTC